MERNKVITRRMWEQKYAAAKLAMMEKEKSNSVLIEIGAQHPLVDGLYPNEEFTNRLLLGRELFIKLRNQGTDAEIFIPGSRHMYRGVADKIALTEAGKRFLLDHDVPEKYIHGSDLIERYKRKAGVYNSADECFVSSSYFRDGNFGKLFSICSPLQVNRKALHYIWFGVLPLFYTAPTQNTYHDYIKEVYDHVQWVRDFDPTMQGEDSFYAQSTRSDRMPPTELSIYEEDMNQDKKIEKLLHSIVDN